MNCQHCYPASRFRRGSQCRTRRGALSALGDSDSTDPRPASARLTATDAHATYSELRQSNSRRSASDEELRTRAPRHVCPPTRRRRVERRPLAPLEGVRPRASRTRPSPTLSQATRATAETSRTALSSSCFCESPWPRPLRKTFGRAPRRRLDQVGRNFNPRRASLPWVLRPELAKTRQTEWHALREPLHALGGEREGLSGGGRCWTGQGV